jgi:hypothetical protein
MGHEVLLDVSFTGARARLAKLTRGGLPLSATENAYGRGITLGAQRGHVHGAAAVPADDPLARVRAPC